MTLFRSIRGRRSAQSAPTQERSGGRQRRALKAAVVAPVTALALIAGLALAGPASASTTAAAKLSGTTTVTTGPGIAAALISDGVLPLPVPGTALNLGFNQGLTVSYGFPITSGNPNLAKGTGDILHSGGIDFINLHGQSLEIGKFDIDLAAGKIFATRVNFAAARVPVLDLNLSKLKVTTSHGKTTLSGIALTLDKVGASALDSSLGIALPAGLPFGSATVALS